MKNKKLIKNSTFFIVLLLFISCKKEIKKEVITQNKIVIDVPKKEITPTYSFDNEFILGKFNYKKDTSFTIVKATHSSKKLYLNKEVYTAFTKMYNDAKKNGITLTIVSGTRSFFEQKYIWERKWEKYKDLAPLKRAKKILEYSSMPSTSRHHWGTDMDINNLNNAYFDAGKGKQEYTWLVNNAHKYGFYQVYTDKKSGRTGYNLERWHWSYLPLSKKYLEYYNKNISYKEITGFKGSELAHNLHIIKEYVNGISEKAK